MMSSVIKCVNKQFSYNLVFRQIATVRFAFRTILRSLNGERPNPSFILMTVFGSIMTPHYLYVFIYIIHITKSTYQVLNYVFLAFVLVVENYPTETKYRDKY